MVFQHTISEDKQSTVVLVSYYCTINAFKFLGGSGSVVLPW